MAFGLPFFHGLTFRSFTSRSFYSLLAYCFAGCFLGVNRGGDEINPCLPKMVLSGLQQMWMLVFGCTAGKCGGGMQWKGLLSEVTVG